MDDLAQAVKILTEELRSVKEALTIELADGTKTTVFEYLSDQIRYLSEVVEAHAIIPIPDEPEPQQVCDERQ